MKELLNKAMAREGVTQSELARRCGVSASLISLILLGKAPLTVKVAVLIERNLTGVTAKKLLDAQTNEQLQAAA
ncbi:TPA: helix-turn-helix domain-containing protein [Burkholderia cenocepacia]|nr:helix-turn-helix domain-containing protein [Burkholderia cenocepacia]